MIGCDSGMATQSGYDAAALWEILTDTVHVLPMYKHHKRYAEKSVLPEKPRISAKEIALLMGIPLGEAIVILEELRAISKGTVRMNRRRRPSPERAFSIIVPSDAMI